MIECYTDYAGGDIKYISPIGGLNGPDAFGECMEICAQVSGCVDVSFQGDSCYLKSSLGAKGTSQTVWGGKLLR